MNTIEAVETGSLIVKKERIQQILTYNKHFNNVYISFCDLGFGGFAKRDFKAGEEICIFEGEIITFKDTITHPEGECMSLQIDHDKYINTKAPGCYFNHSCEPNAGIINDVILIALEDIPVHSEIRFDYSTTMDEDHFTMPCLCGRPTCRKKVTDFKYLPANLQKSYLDKGIVMNFIKNSILVSS